MNADNPFAEIVESPRAPPPKPPSGAEARGIALMICGFVTMFFGMSNGAIYGAAMGGYGPFTDFDKGMIATQIAIAGAMFLQGGLIARGGFALLRGVGRGWAWAGALATMLPPACILVLLIPFGIWALFVLRRADVHAWFARGRPSQLV